MADIQTNYPGIRRIIRFPHSLCPPNCELMAAGKQKVICPFSRDEVQFFGVPTLNSTTKVETNGKISEAKLTFRSNNDLPLFGYCYAVELEDRRAFMLGDDVKMPMVARASTSGVPDGDPKVHTYEISMKGAYSPIECLM